MGKTAYNWKFLTSANSVYNHETCLQGLGEDALFEDPDFPADEAALFYSPRPPEELEEYTWVSPKSLDILGSGHTGDIFSKEMRTCTTLQ
jgi:hypothetical protein